MAIIGASWPHCEHPLGASAARSTGTDHVSTVPWTPAARRALRLAASLSRPQVGSEPGFEPGERGDVRPDPSRQDVAHSRVVDAGHSPGLAKAAPTERPSEPQGQEAGHFGHRVVARHLGPRAAVGARGGSDRPGHSGSVDRAPLGPLVPTDTTVTAPVENGGRNHHPDGAEIVARKIEDFIPDIPERYWAVIGTFVRAAVADAQPATAYTANSLLSTVARHVLWCWQSAGLELDRAVVFDRWVIEEYTHKGAPHLSAASRGNRRSQLFRVAEALLGPEGSRVPRTPLPASDPVRPYCAAELTALRSWAYGQATATRRRDAATLLALGAGAGLAVEDIAGLLAGMVTVDEEGVLLSVPGRRARLVPVLVDWEEALIEAARSVPPERPLFGEERHSANKNFVTNFVAKSSGVEIKPLVQRLRATWIVHHLTARTPVVPFMAAAGVQSLDALTRYLRFIPGIDPAEARRALRGQLREGAGR